MEKTILNLLNKYNGNWDDIYTAVSQRENIDHHKLNFDFPSKLNSCFIGYKDYPDKFKDIVMPPFFVFWYGNLKLLDNCVLGFTGPLLEEDYQLLLSQSQLLVKYTLCFNASDINQSIIKEFISRGYNIILVASGGVNDLQLFDELLSNKLLLVSEFWDAKTYQPAEGQTVERIIFAIANVIYLITHDFKCIEKFLFNYEHKKKTLFCHHSLKEFMTKFSNNNLKISYVKNIHDIV